MKKIILCVFGFWVCISSLHAGTRAIFETKERFHPVMSQHGMVASQETLATQAGVLILQQGGHAVDAAVATAFALAVTLPRAGNLGGNGFMLIWDNQHKKAHALNYRGKAPAQAFKNIFLNEQGEIDEKQLTQSARSSVVPGTVAGLLTAHKKFGKLPLNQVMAPAVELAEKGFVVSMGLANALAEASDKLQTSPLARKLFFKEEHQVLQAGDQLVQKDLARSLKLIAKHGAEAFYEGDIAKNIVAFMKKNKGLITEKDLKNYRAEWLAPLKSTYRDYTVYAVPPPSSGITIIEILNMLETMPIQKWGLNSAKTMHMMTEAMNLAYRDRNHYLGDPDFVKIPLNKLMSKVYALNLVTDIDSKQHTPSTQLVPPKPKEPTGLETTHFSIVDKEGNMVANTFSLNYSFGSGLMVPKAGFFLNNTMDDFSAKEGQPNAYGLIQGKANNIAPNKRPLSSMSPVFLISSDKKFMLATGSPGGSRIITTVLQVLINVVDHHLSIASAVLMPRFHSQLFPDEIFYEQGFSEDTLRLLKKMGHTVTPIAAMGSAQTIALGSYRQGIADTRRIDAKATGY